MLHTHTHTHTTHTHTHTSFVQLFFARAYIALFFFARNCLFPQKKKVQKSVSSLALALPLSRMGSIALSRLEGLLSLMAWTN